MDVKTTGNSVFGVLKGLLVPVLLVFLAASCSDNYMGPDSDKARLNIHLTDAPADYQEVNVDVQGLRIHYAPVDRDTSTADSMQDGKWIDLPVEPMRVNLLELQNGIDTLLASAELEPGTYRELRLILGPDNDVMIDSMMHTLKVPSGQQSGYKIKFSTELEGGEELDVVIDFDASRSVHKAGNSGKYILKPVLKAFVEEGETGSISGVVEPGDADPNIFALMGDDTLASTSPDTTGAFLLQGLEAGSYDLALDPANEQYSDTTLTGISVEEGEETDVGTITLGGS